MSWSSQKEKEGIFCTVYFVRRKFFNNCVLFQCIIKPSYLGRPTANFVRASSFAEKKFAGGLKCHASTSSKLERMIKRGYGPSCEMVFLRIFVISVAYLVQFPQQHAKTTRFSLFHLWAKWIILQHLLVDLSWRVWIIFDLNFKTVLWRYMLSPYLYLILLCNVFPKRPSIWFVI